jgi:hypothetical protein
MATLVPCLVKLRSDVNRVAPNRDKASDGAAGDKAHQGRVSDHNDDETGRVPIKDADKTPEIHAVDLDADLRQPGLTMEMIVQHTLSRCRSGAEKRLRYIIYNRRIWEASNGWRQRAYTGDNPHTQHAHFSSSYETKLEASTASWRLEDIPVALTEADKKWLAGQINAGIKSVRDDLESRGILDVKINDKAHTGRTAGDVFRDSAKLRGVLVGDGPDTNNAKIPSDAPISRIIRAADAILAEDKRTNTTP